MGYLVFVCVCEFISDGATSGFLISLQGHIGSIKIILVQGIAYFKKAKFHSSTPWNFIASDAILCVGEGEKDREREKERERERE
jgi:hypothetical protein